MLRPRTSPLWHTAVVLLTATALAGCATRAADVPALPGNPADFYGWDCGRIDDELDNVQQRAADVAYAVDQRAGNNIVALGLGVAVFWPALLAMRPNGLESEELARLKGRYEALRVAARTKACALSDDTLPPTRAAQQPLLVGERLVYEERRGLRGPVSEWTLRLTALRRSDNEYRSEPSKAGGGAAPAAPEGLWKQDHAGNMTVAPDGALQWPSLLRGNLELGAVTAGDILVTGDPMARARMRGQVVAVGPQMVAGRRFDVAVIDLFGDAQRGDAATRVEGVIVIDRLSGVLLRLDLRSAQPDFSLQRRLVRVDAAAG